MFTDTFCPSFLESVKFNILFYITCSTSGPAITYLYTISYEYRNIYMNIELYVKTAKITLYFRSCHTNSTESLSLSLSLWVWRIVFSLYMEWATFNIFNYTTVTVVQYITLSCTPSTMAVWSVSFFFIMQSMKLFRIQSNKGSRSGRQGAHNNWNPCLVACTDISRTCNMNTSWASKRCPVTFGVDISRVKVSSPFSLLYDQHVSLIPRANAVPGQILRDVSVPQTPCQ